MKIKITPLLLVLFCSALFVNTQTLAMEEPGNGNHKAWLFVLSSPSATLTRVPSGYQLQMVHLNNVLGFTDRPYRDSKKIPIDEFMHSWSSGKDSFHTDHPNGVLVAELQSEGKQQHIQERTLMLSHPSYDASSQSLTFTISSLDANSALHPGKLYNVSLFLDDFFAGGL